MKFLRLTMILLLISIYLLISSTDVCANSSIAKKIKKQYLPTSAIFKRTSKESRNETYEFSSKDSFDILKKKMKVTMLELKRQEKSPKTSDKKQVNSLFSTFGRFPCNSPQTISNYRIATGQTKDGELIVISTHQCDAKKGKWIQKPTIRVIKPLSK